MRWNDSTRQNGFTHALTLAIGLAVACDAVVAAEYRDKVLEGDWTIADAEIVTVSGALTGSGDVIVNLPSGSGAYALFSCTNNAVGDFRIKTGEARVTAAEAFGEGAVYNDNDESGLEWRKIHLYGPMTVPNEFYLGNESKAGNWDYRLGSEGNVTLTGLIHSGGSKVRAISGTLRVEGGVVGTTTSTLAATAGGVLVLAEKPLSIGTATLQLQGGGSVRLGVGGNACGSVSLMAGVNLVLDADEALPVVTVNVQGDSPCSVDLNGHDLTVGTISVATTLSVKNTSKARRPTLTVRQAAVHDGQPMALVGDFDFVKDGNSTLGLSSDVCLGGDLTVKAGTLKIVQPAVDGLLAKTVRLDGGALDLGGAVWRCERLEQNGGTIVNGTLYCQTNVLVAASPASTATIAGDVVKEGTGDAWLSGTLATTGRVSVAHREYDLPSGTVLYLPFDTAETLSKDYGSASAKLTAAGVPAYAADGVADGCLYLNGSSSLDASVLPEGIPCGNASRTIALWVKVGADCSREGAMVSWGVADGSGHVCSLAVRDYGDAIGFYPWGSECGTWYGRDVTTNGWHHFAITWDEETKELTRYWDGQKSSGPSTISIGSLDTPAQNLSVGRLCRSMSNFAGWIDELIVLDRVATGEEIADWAATPFARRDVEVSAPEVSINAGSLVVPPPQALFHYTFDSEDDKLRDSSGNGNALYVAQGTPSVIDEDGRSALYLDGRSSLKTSKLPAGLPDGNGVRSLGCFFKADAGAASEACLFSYGSLINHKVFSLCFRSSLGRLGLYAWGSGYDHGVAVAPSDMTGLWNSLVVTWDGAVATVYLNGVNKGSKTLPGELETTAGGFTIGWAIDGWYETSAFKGFLDNVTGWDRVLTDAEAKAFHDELLTCWQPQAVPLPTNACVTVASGAAIDYSGQVVSVASLGGAGSVAATAVSVSDKLCADGLVVTGDLVFANGASIVWKGAAVEVSGTVTAEGAGMIVFPELPTSYPASYELVRASSFVGDFSAWTAANLPRGVGASVFVRDGVLKVELHKRGMFIFIR